MTLERFFAALTVLAISSAAWFHHLAEQAENNPGAWMAGPSAYNTYFIWSLVAFVVSFALMCVTYGGRYSQLRHVEMD